MASLPHKRPLLFIHGMWSTPHVWAGLRAHFHALGHATLAPTLPLHDADPAAPPAERLGTLGIGDYVEAVVSAAAVLPETPIVIGHSMGGMLAQHVAARLQPPGLVLLSPGGTAATTRPSWSALRSMAGVMTARHWWRSPTRIDRDRAMWGIFNGVPREIAEPEIDSLVWDSGRVLFRWRCPSPTRPRPARSMTGG